MYQQGQNLTYRKGVHPSFAKVDGINCTAAMSLLHLGQKFPRKPPRASAKNSACLRFNILKATLAMVSSLDAVNKVYS